MLTVPYFRISESKSLQNLVFLLESRIEHLSWQDNTAPNMVIQQTFPWHYLSMIQSCYHHFSLFKIDLRAKSVENGT